LRKKVHEAEGEWSIKLAVSHGWPMIDAWVIDEPAKMNFQPSFRQRDQLIALAKINSS
jgi:hypothetical protein